MSTSDKNRNTEPLAIDVRLEGQRFYVVLQDGREIGVPYGWFWRLEQATPAERTDWRLIGKGRGIHWESIDEDISVAGLLEGKSENPAQPPQQELATI